MPNFHIPHFYGRSAVKPNPESARFHAIIRRLQALNWLHVVLGLQVIGIVIIFGLISWVVIRKRLVAHFPSKSVSNQVNVNTQIAITPVITQPAQGMFNCTEKQGTVLDKTFYSAVAQDTVPYRVYLPPCYTASNRRYPFVILLHGAGSDQTEWTDELGVQQTLDQGIAEAILPPMILIMPYGGALEYYNQFITGQSFESFILSDLLPEVESNYCTWNAKAGRDMAGISRGGFWVFEIGLRHLDVFGALAGHSSYFDPTNAPADYNPLDLEQTVILLPGNAPRIWLDVAADDGETLQYLSVFAQALSRRQIDLGYNVYPTGEHDTAYWKSHVGQYLAFYGKDWPINPLDLSTCK